MTDRNRYCQNGRIVTYPDVQRGFANRQTSFSGRGNAWKKLLFSGRIAKKFRSPTILQLNIRGLPASKMNVLHYLALQFETLAILHQRDCDPWISQCFVTPVFKPAISTVATLIGVTMIIVRTVSSWLAGKVLIVLPSYTMPRLPSAFTPAPGTLVPIQI